MEKWFGRMFEGVGSTEKDLLLKTKGKIMIQIGNKFIDLLEDGKLASSGDDLFKKATSKDEMKVPGIYLYDDSIYIRIDETLIKLNGEIVKDEK